MKNKRKKYLSVITRRNFIICMYVCIIYLFLWGGEWTAACPRDQQPDWMYQFESTLKEKNR